MLPEKPTFIRRKWGRIAALALVLILAGFILGQAAGANSALVPGSEGDPLVTVSWVEAKLNAFSQALKAEQNERQILEDRMRQLEGGGVERPSPGQPVYITPEAPTYEVVAVSSGKKLLTGSGTEFILRSGNAKALGGSGGGLSNLTTGRNFSSGETIPRDNLFLSARDDGRGVVTSSETIFLVRGGYKIE